MPSILGLHIDKENDMNFKHGSLESIILNAMWELEKSGVYKNPVKEVYEFLSKTDSTKRAYTTIKTVMDRLYEKEVLLRIKQGKKFFYRTAYSNSDIIITSLRKIATQYCNGDMSKLMHITKSMCENDGQILMVN